MSYNKHKDALPEDTIHNVKTILSSLGIEFTLETEKRMDGIYSSVLTDINAGWLTCGKGTNKTFCEASACGEAIEHLANYTAYDVSQLSEEAANWGDFSFYPDEVTVPVMELPSICPDLFQDMRESYRAAAGTDGSDEEIVSLLIEYFGSKSIPCLPFYSVKRDKTVLLPNMLLSNLCGSNGGGAGNTAAEAIGHGLDEIAERYAKEQIYHKKLIPPVVPREYLYKRVPELMKTIEAIERSSAIQLVVKDASLGKGLPVLAVLMIDYENQRYMANFGAHPCMEIALERCLTEMFQSYESGEGNLHRKQMTSWVNCPDVITDGIRNWVSLLKDDVGFLPNSFFIENDPDWQFCPWPVFGTEYSNIVGVALQLETLGKLSTDIYIRNNSYLPLHSYRIYVPGISTTKLPFDWRQYSSLKTSLQLKHLLKEHKEPSLEMSCELLKNVFSPDTYMSSLVFHNFREEQTYALYAALLVENGQTDEAITVLDLFPSKESTSAVRALELMKNGLSVDNACQLLNLFYKDEADYAYCWIDEHPFFAVYQWFLANKAAHSLMPAKKTNYASAVNMLHVRLKKYMLNHPIDQRSTRDIMDAIQGSA